VLTSEDRAALPTRAETEERVRAALATLGDPPREPELAVPGEPSAPAAPSDPAAPDDPAAPSDPAVAAAPSDPAAAPPTGPVALALAEHGLRVRSGLVELGPDCRTPATDGSPAIPAAAIDGASIARCLDALGAFQRASFSAAPEVTYAAAVEVLELLHARGRPLAVSVAAGSVL
jgi:hypothetical protein